jgi:peptidoglycan L-alanyl-D-glutamate endopeptidase CwlK
MSNKFSEISKARLGTCHEDLVTLMYHVLARRDISITCGYRSKDEQNRAYEEGKSQLKWPRSQHNKVPSRAVDIVPYPEKWSSIEAFKELAVIVKEEASLLGIEVEHGGDWTHFKDYPHWQLKAE